MKSILILFVLSLGFPTFAGAAENTYSGVTLGNVDCTLAKVKRLPQSHQPPTYPTGGKSTSASGK